MLRVLRRSSAGWLRRALRWVSAGDRVLGLVMLVMLVYYAATPGIFEGKGSGDGIVNFSFLPSVLLHHTLDMSRTVAATHHWALPVMNGRMTNFTPIGPPIAWLPFYAFGLLLEAAARAVTSAFQAQPFGVGRFQYWMCGLGTLIYGLLGIRALFRLCQRRLGTGAARWAVVGAVFGTPLGFYLLHQPLYQHGLSFACCAVLIERWDAWRPHPSVRQQAALGALGGAAALIRQQDILFLLPPFWDLARASLAQFRSPSDPQRWQALGRSLRSAMLMALVASAVIAPQLLVWHHYFGEFQSPLTDVGYLRWRNPSVLGMLFSMRGGLLSWTPIVYLAACGLVLARRQLPVGMFAALFLLQLYVNASVWDWWSSWSYGARRFCDVMVVVGVGLGALWHCQKRRLLRITVAGAMALLIGWNVVTMEYVRTRATPSSAGVTWAAWERLAAVRAPGWLVAVFRRLGWPFVWPASIPFALRHSVPIRTFEEVYGAYFLYHDFWEHQPRDAAANVRTSVGRRYLASGFGEPDPQTGAVLIEGVPSRPALLLMPLFKSEPIRVHLDGSFSPGPLELRWNGLPVVARREPTGLGFELPRERVRQEINRLELVAPPRSGLLAIRLESLDPDVGYLGPPWHRRRATPPAMSR
jgi:hypothetical protein